MDKNIVIFDFDNTIVNSLDYWHKVIDCETFVAFGKPPFKDMKKYRGGVGNKQMALSFIEITGLDITIEDVYNKWCELMEKYYLTKIKFVKGVKEYITKLKQEGKKLILASATEKSLLEKLLKAYDLDVFEEIYTETSIGYPKLNPKFYQTLLKKIKAKPEQVVLFEDSFVAIKSATSIGITSCALINHLNKGKKAEYQKMCKLVIKNYKSKKLDSLFA